MGVRERTVEQYLDMCVKSIDGYGLTRKWVSPGRDGVPDRIVILNGEVFFVEVKTVVGRLTSTQEREQKRLIDAGAKVFTVYGSEGVDKFIEEVGYEKHKD